MLEFRRVQTLEELEQVQRLRFQVYCQEKKFLPAKDYANRIETDPFDDHSVHFLAIEKSPRSQKILGTMRLILDSEHGFPIEKHFRLSRPIQDRTRVVELSRLIVAKDARKDSAHILMGLSKEVYLYSKENGIDDCYAVLEDPLLRLLTRFGLPFEVAGDRKWCYNSLNSPVFLSVPYTELVLEHNNALFYTYIREPKELAIAV